MSILWKILLEDGSAPSSGGGDVASADTSTDTNSTTPEGSSPEGDDTTPATDGERFIDAPPDPELDNTDNGDEEPGSAGGLEPAPSPTLTGDAAIQAILAKAQAPAAPAPAPQPQAPAPAPTPAPAAPDVAAVVKGFADAVGLEANDPALKSFTEVLSSAQSEAQAAKQALAMQVQRAAAERLFAVMESAPGYTAEVFGEADTLSPDATFGLTPEQMQRRVAVDLEASNLYNAAKAAGKPISAKAAIREAIQKISGFYAKPAPPKPAAPKPQASATAMAPGRTQRREVDVFKQAVRAFHSKKS